jgi:HK97 family phage major capsid protein
MSTLKFPELKEVLGKIEDRQTKLADIFAQAQAGDEGTIDLTKVKGLDNPAAEIKALNDELTELGAKRDELQAVAKAAGHLTGRESGAEPDSPTGATKQRASFAKQLLKSSALSVKGTVAEIDVDIKTLFERGAGWDPEVIRSGRVVDKAERPIQVTDLLGEPVPWSQKAYSYMEETTFTNNAAERSEGGAYGEAALALTERTVSVETIGVYIPATDEQLEDEAEAEAYLNRRLPFMVRQRLDGQILTGNGTAPNVRGVNNVVGIQTQAKGADPTPDAVYKAMTKVKVTGRAMPNAAIFHPNDWQDVRLLRTTDGIYIWGSPSEPGPARIWGLQVTESDAQTENTAIVGDFENFSMLVVRRGVEVKVSDSHSDFFTHGKQAVRAGIRAVPVWLRPAAFATVTGI